MWLLYVSFKIPSSVTSSRKPSRVSPDRISCSDFPRIFYLVLSLNLSKTCPNYYTLYSTPHTKDQNIIFMIIIVFLSLSVNRLAWPVITTGLSS